MIALIVLGSMTIGWVLRSVAGRVAEAGRRQK